MSSFHCNFTVRIYVSVGSRTFPSREVLGRSQDGTGRDGIFDWLSRPVPGRPAGQNYLKIWTFLLFSLYVWSAFHIMNINIYQENLLFMQNDRPTYQPTKDAKRMQNDWLTDFFWQYFTILGIDFVPGRPGGRPVPWKRYANVILRQSRLRASRASPAQKSRGLRVVFSKNFSRATFFVFWVT